MYYDKSLKRCFLFFIIPLITSLSLIALIANNENVYICNGAVIMGICFYMPFFTFFRG